MVETNSTPQIWDAFYKRYYWPDILDLARLYPNKRSLYIEFTSLERFNIDLANELLEHPDTVLAAAAAALTSIELPYEVSLEGVHIRFTELPDRIPIRELRSSHIDKFVSVSGLVRKVTEVRPKITIAAFKCQRCDSITYVKEDDSKFIEPFACDNEVCGRKGAFKLTRDESVFIDAQKLRVQESPEDLRGGEQPQTLDVDAADDLTGEVSPGDRVIITGILRSFQRSNSHGKSTTFDIALEANSIETEEKGFEDIEISKEEVEEILRMSKDKDLYSKVINSIAPSIFGYDEIKEAVALQLFSGIRKTLPDGTQLRGDIHILLIGDPGVAKSQLLRYGIRLAPRGIYTSGKSTTSAGLTATATKEEFGDGKWTLEAGALVLADMGLACVDELDKMQGEDRNSMHEALEQQTISVAKAGIMATLKSRCALLGAANPRFGRFDRYEPIGKQINMDHALLSRFDLIFIMTDEPSISKDRQIAKHILKSHYAGSLIVQKQKNIGGISSITKEDIDRAVEKVQPTIKTDMMRKYIAYSKRTVFPSIPDTINERLIEFYLSLRKQDRPDSPVPVTARQLEALIRLAEASARIRLANTVSEEDIERVIRIVMTSIKQILTDPETGQLDADMITGTGKSQRDRMKSLLGIITSIVKEHKNQNGADIKDILEAAEQNGIKNAYDLVRKLKEAGELIEVRDGQFITV